MGVNEQFLRGTSNSAERFGPESLLQLLGDFMPITAELHVIVHNLIHGRSL